MLLEFKALINNGKDYLTGHNFWLYLLIKRIFRHSLKWDLQVRLHMNNIEFLEFKL